MGGGHLSTACIALVGEGPITSDRLEDERDALAEGFRLSRVSFSREPPYWSVSLGLTPSREPSSAQLLVAGFGDRAMAWRTC